MCTRFFGQTVFIPPSAWARHIRSAVHCSSLISSFIIHVSVTRTCANTRWHVHGDVQCVTTQAMVEREMEAQKRRRDEERYWALRAEEAMVRNRAEAAIRKMEVERALRTDLLRLKMGIDTDSLSHQYHATSSTTRSNSSISTRSSPWAREPTSVTRGVAVAVSRGVERRHKSLVDAVMREVRAVNSVSPTSLFGQSVGGDHDEPWTPTSNTTRLSRGFIHRSPPR